MINNSEHCPTSESLACFLSFLCLRRSNFRLTSQIMQMERPCTPLTIDSSNLLLAIPKKGRLHERSVELLNEIGLQFKRTNRSDIAHCVAAPVLLVFLNVVDIPVFVAEGNVDGGIVGQDVISETGQHFAEQQLLGFGRCVLAVQAPMYLHLTCDDLIGKRVVTSYPRLTKRFFASLEIKQRGADVLNREEVETGSASGMTTPSTTVEGYLRTTVVTLSGSVEASVALGLSDAVVDLVETGDTMRMAGLQQIGVIMKTEAAFISNPNTRHQTLLTMIKKRIDGYLTALKYQMVSYNIPLEKLSNASLLTPGLRSPTITNLADSDWISVTAVVERTKVLDTIDQLDALGAQDILTFNFKHFRSGASP